jgi:hypothetical protein
MQLRQFQTDGEAMTQMVKQIEELKLQIEKKDLLLADERKCIDEKDTLINKERQRCAKAEDEL